MATVKELREQAKSYKLRGLIAETRTPVFLEPLHELGKPVAIQP